MYYNKLTQINLFQVTIKANIVYRNKKTRLHQTDETVRVDNPREPASFEAYNTVFVS